MSGPKAHRHRNGPPPEDPEHRTAPPSSGALSHCEASAPPSVREDQITSVTASGDAAARTLSLQEAERLWWITDPRWQDFSEDRELWMLLLSWAYDVDGAAPDGLFGILHGLRCLGARLESHPSGIRLRPGEIERGDYSALKQQYLLPRSGMLKRLLVELEGEMKLRETLTRQLSNQNVPDERSLREDRTPYDHP